MRESTRGHRILANPLKCGVTYGYSEWAKPRRRVLQKFVFLCVAIFSIYVLKQTQEQVIL